MTTRAESAGVATIVAQVAVTKREALGIIASALGSEVDDTASVRPRVPIEEAAWAEVEIPKFGEPPPLAVDVHSALGLEHARLVALRLAQALEESTGWSLEPDFLREPRS